VPSPNDNISFVDHSLDRDGVITNWTWEFSPGVFRYGQQVTHVFPNPGTYTVYLTVTDNMGDQDTVSQSLKLSSDTGDTPGFEVIILLLSLTLAMIYLKGRKPFSSSFGKVTDDGKKYQYTKQKKR
jgi:hypothetical protein